MHAGPFQKPILKTVNISAVLRYLHQLIFDTGQEPSKMYKKVKLDFALGSYQSNISVTSLSQVIPPSYLILALQEDCGANCAEISTVAGGIDFGEETVEGSDIVNAVIEESITMNIVIYIVMMIFTTMLVSYAVYLSWKIVTKGRQSLNNLSLTRGYEPVAQS